MAWAPEPQTRLTVIAGTETGSPAPMAACRAGFMRLPAWITFPNTTLPTSPGSIPARATVARIAAAPRSTAGTAFSEPL
ncbi:hypothetical protein D3C72_2264290 [compost metagenome]